MSYQDELLENFQKAYPNCEVKKINKDSNIDIYVPGLHERRNVHINFDVKKDGVNVKLHFVLPDLAEYRFFLEKLSDEVSAYGKEGSGSQGIFHNNKLIAYNKYDEIISSASLMIDLFKNNLTSYSSGSKAAEATEATEPTEVIETEIKERINKAYDNNNVAHCLCFLALSVVVPGLGSIDEQKRDNKLSALSDEITKWLRLLNFDVNEDGVIDRHDSLDIIFDYVMPHFEEIDSDAIIIEIYRACALLMSINVWPEDASLDLVAGITKVAVADGQITQSEIKMITTIATGLAVVENERIIKILNSLKEIVREKENGIEKKKEEKGDAIISDIPDFPVYTKLTAEQVNIICERIQSQLTLPHLGFVFDDLREHYGDYLDRHVPFYYHDNLVVGEEMEGFVFVNMDGFYGNIQDKDEIIPFFSWDSVGDMKIKVDEDDNTVALGLFPKEGEGFLSIEEKDGTSLKIVHQLYWSVYKQIIERFEDEPAILWDIVRDDLNIDMQSFNNWDEFVDFKQ